MATVILSELNEMRAAQLASTGALLEALVMDPSPPTKIEDLVHALRGCLRAYEELAKATSQSNRGYELMDLRADEKKAYEQAQHHLRILQALYSPQAKEG